MSEPDAGAHPVARQYDRWASVYDRLWRHYIDQTLPVLDAWAALQPGERVLDVGCGTGAFEARHVRADARNEFVGIDLSANMLHQARAKLANAPQVTFRQADVQAMPFDDDRFDVVVSASTFHYVDNASQALTEMARVVRPGGRMVILDWCQDFWMCRVPEAILSISRPGLSSLLHAERDARLHRSRVTAIAA